MTSKPIMQRRAVLQAGIAGSLSLPTFWQHAATADGTSAQMGRAKRCIFLFMWGGPSQLETFDPKPHAPAEIRGEFKAIATRTPGLLFGEHMPQLAAMSDKFAIVRSLNHDDPAHLSSGHTILTGHLPPVNKSDAEPPSDRDTPHVGAALAKLRPTHTAMPAFVTAPWKAFHPSAPGGRAPGQHGGWLGQRYDPFLVTGDPNQANWQVPALSLIDGVSTQRLQHRQSLLTHLDSARARLDSVAAVSTNEFQRKAFGLLAAPKVRKAFDLNKEPPPVRDRYGRNIHGQCVLLARRLIEHGVPFVSVNWHNDGKNFWDTHGNNFNRLKQDLLPPSQQALTALLTDLDQSGLLDETLVVWVGEFGRNPNITKNNAGREHWPYCYNGLLAGGGIRGGTVYGSSDKHAAYPATFPVSPHDFTATVYHALGVPQSQTLKDRSGRPHHLYAGTPVLPLFG